MARDHGSSIRRNGGILFRDVATKPVRRSGGIFAMETQGGGPLAFSQLLPHRRIPIHLRRSRRSPAPREPPASRYHSVLRADSGARVCLIK